MTKEYQRDFVIEKHWLVYIKPLFYNVLGILIFYISLSADSKLIFIIFAIIGILLLLVNIYKIFKVQSVKWILNPSELYIIQGVFPWNRKIIQVPIFYISMALVSSGRFGCFLNFGHITIRRTGGIFTEIKETYLADGIVFSQIINQCVMDYKVTGGVENFYNYASVNFYAELKHLVNLKDNGEITPEEYKK